MIILLCLCYIHVNYKTMYMGRIVLDHITLVNYDLTIFSNFIKDTLQIWWIINANWIYVWVKWIRNIWKKKFHLVNPLGGLNIVDIVYRYKKLINLLPCWWSFKNGVMWHFATFCRLELKIYIIWTESYLRFLMFNNQFQFLE